MSRRSLVWFRRDLRVVHHGALAAAAAEGGEVVPVFVFDPAFSAATVRQSALRQALAGLQQALGGKLVLASGDPVVEIPRLAAQAQATAVFVTRDHAPYGVRRDAATAAALQRDGRHLVEIASNYAVAPGTITKADGTPYAVFTPYSRAWRAHGYELPTTEVAPPASCTSAGLESDQPLGGWSAFVDVPVDERAASERWEQVLADLGGYRELRNLPAIDGTTRLSAALRWGTVHPSALLADLVPGDVGHDTLASELAWRDFYADVLHRRPDSAWANLDRRMDAMPVDTDAAARERFARWSAGTTGYPFVDAGMRQLLATGWMHNRLRMVVASFLVKDLHLPWQWGALYFLRHLADGDLASNNHGWQWCAGTGTDAAPYFRVFNPLAQGLRFDPDGEYVRQWVPELAALPGASVHDPGRHRPDDYPPPLVDHAHERAEALARYRRTLAGTR
jgi:deoxyribodipyrimidine photo-lyase